MQNEATRHEKQFLMDNLVRKEQIAKERVQNEKKINSRKINSMYGQQIAYGKEIMLQHVDSDDFLTAAQECSNTSKIGYKVY